MRVAPLSWAMIDRQGNDFRSMTSRQGGQKAVHMIEIGKFQKQAGVKDLDAAT